MLADYRSYYIWCVECVLYLIEIIEDCEEEKNMLQWML